MKCKRKLATIPFCMFLISCSGRNYEPFEDLNAQQVKKICESYAERVYNSKNDAKFIFLDKVLGVFKDNTVFVNVLKYEEKGVGFSDTEVNVYLVSDTLPKTYFNKYTFIYSLANCAYGYDVHVTSKGSFSIQDAYDNGYLTDNEITILTENFKYTLN